MNEKLRGSFVFVLKYLVVFLILFFLIKTNYGYISQMQMSDLVNINWYYIVLSVIFQSLAFCFLAYLWGKQLGILGMKIPSKEALLIWTKSQFAKYLPGMIWFAVGRVMMLNKYKFNKKKASLTILLEVFFLISGTFLVGAMVYLFYEYLTYFFAALVLVVIGLLISKPAFTFAKSKFKQLKDIEYAPAMKTGSLYLIYALLSGTSFLCVYLAISNLEASNFVFVSAAFLLSWVAGFLFIITPNGLGIRELVMSYLLGPVAPMSTIVIVVLYSRVVWTISEMTSFIFSVIYKNLK